MGSKIGGGKSNVDLEVSISCTQLDSVFEKLEMSRNQSPCLIKVES